MKPASRLLIEKIAGGWKHRPRPRPPCCGYRPVPPAPPPIVIDTPNAPAQAAADSDTAA